MTRVLVVDDEPAVLFALEQLLVDRGHVVVAAATGTEALRHLQEVDVVVTDLMMPGLDGMGLLRSVHQHAPGVPVIMVTAQGSERAAVAAMKAGAAHYLTKPFDVDEVALLVARVAEHAQLRRDAIRSSAERERGRPMIGEGPAMRSLLATVERVARRDVAVLVRGESGTGKELVCTLLHSLSGRSKRQFVRFNAAAIPHELAEAELFGHTKGAFTGATETRAGFFARADGGTLVLDEVGELPFAIQATLLRALQDGEIQPVGGAPRSVDVRVIAATNRDLAAMVRAGGLREDLYYRLAVVEIVVPPLRDRREDIPDLARAFAARIGAEWNVDVTLSDALLDALAKRDWPGNVRELENSLARWIALSETGSLGTEVLAPPPVAARAADVSDATLPFRARVDAFETSLIRDALAAANGNRAEAARRLGMSRVTMLDRMKRLGILA